MFVVAIHDISDPDKFWNAAQTTPIPEGIKLHQTFPRPDQKRAICLWEADSVDAVKNLVEPATEGASRNEFFEVEPANAMGLPA